MGALTTISSKFQIAIPRDIREKFNLTPGQKVLFMPYRNSIRLVIVPPIEAALGIFEGVDTTNLREEQDEERA
ncbi:MAG: hypothetical protein OHK0052_21740 [Anaerolineales bacterium]